MSNAEFNNLLVIRREWECKTGCSEICDTAWGERFIRVCLQEQAAIQAFLLALPTTVPARLKGSVLELLLPYCDGVSLKQWLCERNLSLGDRRQACLSLLAQLIGDRTPPCLLVSSAVQENLMLTEDGAHLRYMPNLTRWREGLTQAQAVCAAAVLIEDILTKQTSSWQRYCFPLELQLICKRTKSADYLTWSQLQRDLSALPNDFPRLGTLQENIGRKIQLLTHRFKKPALGLITVILLLLAILSLVSSCRLQKNEQRSILPDMTPIGNQELGQEQEVP